MPGAEPMLQTEHEPGDPEDRWIGEEICGYRVLRLLGHGGMARVYEAEHMRLGRRVALKMLRESLAADEASRARFFEEARAVNQIAHPNIIEVHDFLEQPDTPACYVMELLEGEDLSVALQRDGPLPLSGVLQVGVQLASAMATVHGAGIVHRDLKPQNIILTPRPDAPWFITLLDFGVCKLADDEAMETYSATETGTIVGTPDYMAPEQIEDGRISPRTDVYALGAVLYQLLCGSPPFTGPTVTELAVRVLTQDPKPPSERAPNAGVPPALDDLLLRCLSKRPADRPSSMAEVERALLTLQGRAVAGRGRLVGVVAAGCVAAALAGGGLVFVATPTADAAASAPASDGAPTAPGRASPPLSMPRAPVEPAPSSSAATVAPIAPTVRVSFASTPSGATVTDAAGEVLGVTPFAIDARREAVRHAVQFALDGHRDVSAGYLPDDATSVDVDLQALATQPPRPARATKPRRERKTRKTAKAVAASHDDTPPSAAAGPSPSSASHRRGASAGDTSANHEAPTGPSDEQVSQPVDAPPADSPPPPVTPLETPPNKERIGGGDLIDPFAS